ncbi:MAG: TRAP transporter large permease [Candidatus Puniceispirillales bacterium WSBS_2018_MAG_OTU23]
MTDLAIGFASFPMLLILIFLRVPIGLAMFLTGAVGLVLITGNPNIVMAKLKNETYTSFSSYSLSIVPMFLLMGHFATLGGISTALFKAAEGWLGHRRGGVAMAAIGACAGFGAICGSSLATSATMGRVALPELKRYGYPSGFSAATLAAGGTLGILIPPSLVLVIYALITEQNIAKLFIAAIIPGVLAAGFYMAVVAIYVRLHKIETKTRLAMPYRERFRALGRVWGAVLIFVVVIFGIAGDWNWTKDGTQALFTPTEGAAVGALGMGLIAFFNKGLTAAGLAESFKTTGRTTAMIFFIVLGAGFYNGFLALSQVPQEISASVVLLGLNPWGVLTLILLIYLVMGCFMDSLSMILLTVPIFFPVMMSLDFGMPPEHVAIWFGILVLIVVEVGLITPPVGLNLFVINAIGENSAGETYKAVIYFVAADIVRVALLVMFPAITVFTLWG